VDDSNNELERLKRLREQQLRDRDPLKKQRKVQRTVTRKYRARKNETLGELIAGVSHKLKGLIVGLFLGLLIWFLLALVFQETWVDLAGILAVVFLPALGVLFGGAFDTRDNLRDF
jgi:Flp pilus assembly protein TadB